ncbi:phosphoethanolamine--lipid A transferase [Comamonas terrigena]|uniref:phosphoethanolamine transferase n=1 Tax=Comamonas terrigena TaxID=32013 RepID=UPI00244C3C6C|nr:phosphoethanolamine--lipid A transferase [Comamonas terrigena]MDH1293376.1 phosphoethanolamine--lipid A transferase [Comamonas terrigena]
MKIVDWMIGLLKAKEANISWLIIGTSIWLATVCNYPLWMKLSSIDRQPDYLFYLGFSLLISGLGIFIFSCLAWGKLLKYVLSIFVLMAAFGAYFMQAYGVVIDKGMITNVLQTDKREAFDLLNSRMVVTVLFLSIPMLWVIWKTEQPKTRVRHLLGQHLILAALGILISVVSLISVFQAFASTMRNHKEVRYLINPFNSLYAMGKLAADPFKDGSSHLEKIGEDARINDISKTNSSPILILIIGETARSDHLGVNGYYRNTTPLLNSRNDIASFNNAWSCGTSTAESLPCMFSHLNKNDFFDRDSNYENLLDVMNRAGISTIWIDNQSGCKGVCARISTSNIKINLNDKDCYSDGCFDIFSLKKLEQKIDNLSNLNESKGVAVLLHQMGSHGPAYYKRSSSERKKYFPECVTSSLQSCAREDVVNAYDNSIVETDFFISSTIDWIKENYPDRPTAMMYVSDHGESLGENNIYLHGLPYSFAPDSQKRIPWIVWLSEKFMKINDLRSDCFEILERDKRISHDNYFHTTLGLLGIETKIYVKDLDIFTQCRDANP